MKVFPLWSSLIICAPLISAHRFPCDVDFESEVVTTVAPSTTQSPEHSIASLFVRRYGDTRILDGPICLMDGTCVNVLDSVQVYEDGITFTREISTQEVWITTMFLKKPQNLNRSNIDTSKWELDHESLDFTSYTTTMIEEMFASGAVEISPNANAEVLSIGLGAGYIDSYLYKNYPMMNITVVEIDQNMLDIALKWFGLQLDNRHRVVIEDGVEYVKRAISGGAKFDVIHVDACTMEDNVELNCPIDIFFTPEMVRNFASLLKPRGAVILNVVSFARDDMAAVKKVEKAFKKAFKKCLSEYAPFSPPNVVMTCTQFQRPPGLKERYQQLKGYSTAARAKRKEEGK